MIRTFNFKDWSGHQIKALLKKENNQWVCEIKPHDDAWWPAGSGRNEQEAIKEAVDFWNSFDSNR